MPRRLATTAQAARSTCPMYQRTSEIVLANRSGPREGNGCETIGATTSTAPVDRRPNRSRARRTRTCDRRLRRADRASTRRRPTHTVRSACSSGGARMAIVDRAGETGVHGANSTRQAKDSGHRGIGRRNSSRIRGGWRELSAGLERACIRGSP